MRTAVATRTSDTGQWRSLLFFFIRLLSRHPDFATCGAKKAIKEFEKMLKAWSRGKGGLDPTSPDLWVRWLGVETDDAHAEILDAWDQVRRLPGYAPLDDALEQARHRPLTLHADTTANRPERYQTFISIAGWLQVVMGDRNILLPVEEVAKVLGVDCGAPLK